MTTAFISYSSRNRQIGERFQRALEWYRMPRALRGRRTRYGEIGKHIGPIYRDRSDLAASGDLGATIERALTQARYLIVLCSPASASSPWVNREIEYFRNLGKADEIIAVLVDGLPAEYHATDAPDGAFPPALTRGDLSSEPFAPDLRPVQEDAGGGDGFDMAKLKVVSRIVDIPLGELTQRHLEADRRERRMMVLAGITFTALAAGAVLWWQEARRQEIEKLGNESRLLAERARALVDSDDPLTAMRMVMGGLPRSDERPVIAEARRELRRALHLNRQLACFDAGDWVAALAPDPARPGVFALSNRTHVAFWDLEQGRPLDDPTLQEEKIVGLDFSADGRWLAAANVRGDVLLLDSETGKVLRPAPAGERSAPKAIDISPRGDRVALVSVDGNGGLTLWNPSTGALQAVPAVGDAVGSAAFGPDGTRLLVSTPDGALLLQEEEGNPGAFVVKHNLDAPPKRQPDPGRGDFVRVIFDRTGERAIIVRDRHVSVFNVATGRQLVRGSLESSGDLWVAVVDVDISPDNGSIALAASDRSIRIWDLRTARETLRLTAESQSLCENERGEASIVRYTADGRLASVYTGGTVRLWDVGDLPPRLPMTGVGRHPRLAVKQDGSWIVASTIWTRSDTSGELGIWTGPEAPLIHRWPGLTIDAIDLSRDGRRVAVWLSEQGNRPLEVQILTTGLEYVQSVTAELGVRSALALDERGEKLAMAAPGRIDVVSVKDGTVVARQCLGRAKVTQLVFSPEGNHLLGWLSNTEYPVRRWALTSGQALPNCAAEDAEETQRGDPICDGVAGVRGIAAGPNGLVACLASSSASLVEADAPSRQPVVIRPLMGNLTEIAFSADGESIAGISSPDLGGDSPVERLAVWHTRTATEGRIAGLPYEPDADLKRVAFSPDGDFLVTLAAVQGPVGGNRHTDLAVWRLYADVHVLVEAAERAIPGCLDAIAVSDTRCALPDGADAGTGQP